MSSKKASFSSAFQKKVFTHSASNFNELCLELFHFQAENNAVYKKYLNLIGCQVSSIADYRKIPFLPISAFKTHDLKTNKFEPAAVFTSSGTSGNQTSRHFVKDLSIYENSFELGFEHFYGRTEDYCVLGLLPSYLEREGSSLIYMVDRFIQQSTHPKSGFFLNNQEELFQLLQELSKENTKVLLIGVSFALLDFAEKYDLTENPNLVVMETGGMKGRRKELVREELHAILKQGFSVKNIHSEYGMTELLSQGYSKGDGIFETPPWMKVLVRKQDDPFSYVQNEQVGVMNVIDLANINSCAFLQTDDLGKLHSNGTFEVLGRQDASDVRGCNLMVS